MILQAVRADGRRARRRLHALSLLAAFLLTGRLAAGTDANLPGVSAVDRESTASEQALTPDAAAPPGLAAMSPAAPNVAGCPVTALASDGSTSNNERAPNANFFYGRSVWLITAAEASANGLLNGTVPGAIGFRYATAPGAVATGSLKVYLQNTTDTANTKNSNWSSAISGMTLVHNNVSTTLPNTTAAFDIPFSGTGISSFTYSGGGIYVAFDWQWTGPATTAALVACNSALANGLRGAQSSTSVPTTIASSSQRPETRLTPSVATIVNDASVDYVLSLGSLPQPLVGPQTVQAVVSNRGANILTNLPVTLIVSGAQTYNNVQTVVGPLAACGGQAVVTFAPFSLTATGSDTVTVSVPADNVASNNSQSRPLNSTFNLYSYKHAGTTAPGGVGVTGNTGDIVGKFTVTAAAKVSAINLEFFATSATTYRVAVYPESSPGSGVPATTPIYQDAANRTVAAAGPVTITLPAPLAVGPGTFFAGIQQTNTTNASLSADAENPVRVGAFYLAVPHPAAAWSDLSPGNNAKPNIGVTLVQCQSAAECNDGNPCTDDACTNSLCVHTNSGATSCDGSPCTDPDQCRNGACIPGPNPCDDLNACTTDVCGALGDCTYTVVNCDDNNPCTDDSCIPASGCAHANNTIPCNDGNPCTIGDACGGGACLPGTGGLPAPVQFCNNTGIVIPISGAAPPYPSPIVVSGRSSYLCSATVSLFGFTHSYPSDVDVLLSGPSGANALVMSDVGGSAGVASVDVVLSDAAAAPLPLDGPLASGTYLPTNYGGDDVFPAPAPVPAGGSALSVFNGSNPNGAWNLWVDDEFSPDGGSFSGWCVDVVAACSLNADCDDGNPCTNDGCGGGACSHVNNTNSCNDGNACTPNDTCNNGSCVGGPPPTCDDHNACTTNACNPQTGLCENPPISCNDANPCTDDSCKPSLGCVFAPNNANACSDNNLCTITDVCLNGQCVGTNVVVCPPDANPCTTEACDPTSGACLSTDNTNACDDGNVCTIGDVCGPTFLDGFDGVTAPALPGVWTTTVLGTGNPWTTDSTSNDTPPNSAFGYDGSDAADELLTSPPMSVTTATARLTFRNRWSFEGASPFYDGGVLEISIGGAAFEDILTVGGSFASGGYNGTVSDCCGNPLAGRSGWTGVSPGYPSYLTTAVNLPATAAGRSIRLRWRIGSDTSVGSAGQNIDSIVLLDTTHVCNPGTGTPDCDDGNPCTNDSCDPVTGCQHVPNAVSCDDGNACTTGDTCSGGTCQPGTGVLDCNDNNVCTTDSCNPIIGCRHTNNVAACDDANACTTGDTCSGGACQPGSAVVCNDNNVCTTDTCNPATGCVFANNTLACSDGNACTTGDTCGGGACQPGLGVLDCNDNNVCTTDSCNPTIGCKHAVNAAPCDDGNACTTGDTCASGSCQPGTAIVCNDNNVCTTDTCSPATGCVFTNNTIACNDGNACTTGDVCGGGACAGTAVVCNDNNVCTTDTCNTTTGCVFTNNTIACNDGSACTSGDTCSGGSCVGTAVNCDDGNVCTADTCNTSTGCVHTNNTVACNDGNACTTGDVCSGGSCQPGSATVCNDNNVCTTDTCNTATGCVFTNNTRSCNDGNACTNNDRCSGGTCVGAAVNCDDGNVCTTDSCNTSTGCVHVNNTLTCSDGSACTTGDVCSGGTCNGTAVVCNDDNLCTTDTCNTSTGCVFTNNTIACSDGNACTTGDACSGGSCHAGTGVLNCDDANVCTTDSCSPATGCVHTNNTLSCSDGNACTQTDTCQGGVCVGANPVVCTALDACHVAGTCNTGTGVCTNPNAADGTSCSDGSACTTGDACTGGACQPGAAVVCDDNNVCTTDTCNPIIGCRHINNVAACDDGDACTAGDTCSGGACQPGSAVVCNDNNVCTTDTCSPATGCVFANNTLACSDGNACTTGDTCGGGACQPGLGVLDCNDNNVCTTDSCNPTIGCKHAVNTAPCDDGNACTTGDTCGSGSCQPGTAIVCNDNNVCTTDTCSPATGCVFTNNTIACDDGSACTTGDTCGGGTCAGSAVNCDDGNVCTTDSCSPATGCVYTDNTIACNDGSACTTGDVCSGGTCAGSAVNCDDGNVCTTDSCSPATGCAHTNSALACNDGNACTTDTCNSATGCVFTNNTLPCSDGNACTTGDTCGGGTCQPGAAVVCNDSNVCTTDACNPASGCVFSNNALSCSDGNACTLGDLCANGACQPGAGAPNCNDNNPCTTDSCNPASGCVHADNTTACDDGNACTVGDACFHGSCQPGPGSLNCDDNNVCTTDSCNAATGCIYTANTAPCDDGSACTLGDTCADGSCRPGAEFLGCDDGNVCTTDACDPATGCVYAPNTAPCDDGSACTTGDVCANGTCNPGPPLGCNDGNACTMDSCNAATGCVHASLTGTSWGEAFDGYAAGTELIGQGGWSGWNDNPDVGATISGSRARSAPNSVAILGTSDVLRPFDALITGRWIVTVWQFVPNDMTGVSYLDLLNRYDASGVTSSWSTQVRFDASQNLVINSGVSRGTAPLVKGRWVQIRVEIDLVADTQAFYYDGQLLFQGSWTSDLPYNGSLAIAAVNMVGNRSSAVYYDDFNIVGTSCDDGNVCTTDSCDPATGCAHANNAIACNDGSVCTTGDTCSGGFCSGTAVACNDNNVCTTDTCDPATGCVFTNNTSACDDGNPCTTGELCNAGVCQGGTGISPPPETGNFAATSKTTFSWSPVALATQYDVVRGDLAGLPVGPGGGNEICFGSLAATSVTDPEVPAAGAAFWYLSRGENACGVGTYGTQGVRGAAGAPRVTTTCP